MKTTEDKNKGSKSRANANAVRQLNTSSASVVPVLQQKENSEEPNKEFSTFQQKSIKQFASGADDRSDIKPFQLKPNNTGLPDNLKSGVENLSGMSMDHVKVHYNSSQPAQLNALAYAQGSDIHVGPGQEKHLPHEAWHVVQQAQGRVQPTTQMKVGVAVNDDPALEHEADVMGEKAMSVSSTSILQSRGSELQLKSGAKIIQCAWAPSADLEIAGLQKWSELRSGLRWYHRPQDDEHDIYGDDYMMFRIEDDSVVNPEWLRNYAALQGKWFKRKDFIDFGEWSKDPDEVMGDVSPNHVLEAISKITGGNFAVTGSFAASLYAEKYGISMGRDPNDIDVMTGVMPEYVELELKKIFKEKMKRAESPGGVIHCYFQGFKIDLIPAGKKFGSLDGAMQLGGLNVVNIVCLIKSKESAVKMALDEAEEEESYIEQVFGLIARRNARDLKRLQMIFEVMSSE